MKIEEMLALFKECNALLQGHFLLTSGLHSPSYLQCALVCRRPEVCSRLCAELAKTFDGETIDAVIGPAMGGIVLAYELARALNTDGIFMERDGDGTMTLRRGFAVNPGDSVIVVEDVMTTGRSAAEVIKIVEQSGTRVAGVACLVDRGGSKRFKAYRVASLLQIEVPTYEAADCPLCREGLELVKPGSRKKPGA